MALSFPLSLPAWQSTCTPLLSQLIRSTTNNLEVLVEEGLDLVQFVLAQAKLCRANYAVYLVGPPAPYDGRRHRLVAQRPGYGYLPGGAPVFHAYLLEQAHALGAPLAGEQPAPHRRVGDHADVVLLAVREYLVLDATFEHVVWRLQGLDRGDLPYALHLLDVEVRDPDVADLALLLELGHRLPALLDVLVRPWPVDLVEVYGLHLQPTEALLALALYGVLLEVVGDVATLVPYLGALGEDVGTLRNALEGPGHELLGVAEAVDGGGIDPVHAELDGPPYGPHRLVVVLRAPGGAPSAPTYGPATEAYARYLHLRPAEPHALQSVSLRILLY